jgi:hypothetical protein
MTALSCLALFFMAITRRERGVRSCFKYKKVPPRAAREKRFALHRGPSLDGQDPISSLAHVALVIWPTPTPPQTAREKENPLLGRGAHESGEFSQ